MNSLLFASLILCAAPQAGVTTENTIPTSTADAAQVSVNSASATSAHAANKSLTELSTEQGKFALSSVTLGYADHLFRDGDYYRAIGEYRRYLYLTRGQGSAAARVAMAIGEAYLRGGQLDAAASQYESVAEHATDPLLRSMALLSAGRAALINEKPMLAAARLAEARSTAVDMPEIINEATFLLGWARFARKDWNGARAAFYNAANSTGPRAAVAATLVKRLDERGDFSRKDPLVAGALSLIPGVGHMYLGMWNVGIAALTWNALFAFATGWSIATGQWGVAAVLGVFEMSWFSGTMFGALNGAMRYNHDVEQNWIDEVSGAFGRSRRLGSIRQAPDLPGSFSRLLPQASAKVQNAAKES